MIITKLQGGLGNQMFQYAFARAMALRHGVPFALDAVALEAGEGITRRHLSLDHFRCELNLIDSSESTKHLAHSAIVNQYEHRPFHLPKPASRVDTYFVGNWQNEKYFADYSQTIRRDFELRKPFSTKAAKIAGDIMAEASIAVQVRRGDYVTNPKVHSLFHVCQADYFRQGVEIIASQTGASQLYVFSDDIAWCEQNLKFNKKTTYVSKENLPHYEEVALMALTKHAVISNSSFGWWGAWLIENPDKIIVAPYQWLKKENVASLEIVPHSWTKI